MVKVDAQEKPNRSSRPPVLAEEVHDGGLDLDHAVYEPISGAEVVESLQSILGNELVLEALSGEVQDGLSSFVGGEISESIAGQGSGSGAMRSNAAMLKVMRDASIDWEDSALEGLKHPSGGRALPEERLERFSRVFEHDFSHVRIHTGGAAGQAADALNAHAFALGAHIFFGKGTYSEQGRATDRLLAHELTHVVQHDEGRLPSSSGENEVSSPSDPSEQEAYANEVRMMSRLDVLVGEAAPSFETWEGFWSGQTPQTGGEGEEGAGDAAIGGHAMRKRNAFTDATSNDAQVMKLIRQSRGAPIPDAVAARLGQAMGQDVSAARIHTDSAAAKAAELLNAKAFALGADIFFAKGQYAPGTKEGDRLFAHELAHVTQFGEGRLPRGSAGDLDVSSPSDSAEIEAESVAATASVALDVATSDLDQGVEAGAFESAGAVGDIAMRAKDDEKEDLDVDAALAQALADKEDVEVPEDEEVEVEEAEEGVEEEAAEETVEAESTDPESGEVTEVSTEAPTAQGPSMTAPSIEPPTFSTQVPSESEDIASGWEAFSALVLEVRTEIEGSAETLIETMNSTAEETRANTLAATEALKSSVSASIEAARGEIRSQAEAARSEVAVLLSAKKAELQAHNLGETNRVLEASAAHKEAIGTLISTLAQQARDLGNTRAEEFLAHITAKADEARSAAADVAGAWSGDDRANDIRVTVSRMAQETASNILSESQAAADGLRKAGEDLALKIEEDGVAHQENMGSQDDQIGSDAETRLAEAEQSLDDYDADFVGNIDATEQEMLGQLDALEPGIIQQIEGIGQMQVDATESSRADGEAAIRTSLNTCLTEMDAKMLEAEAWVISAHPSQAASVLAALDEGSEEVRASGVTVVAHFQGAESDMLSAFESAGSETASGMDEASSSVDGQINDVVTGSGEAFGETVSQYEQGLNEAAQQHMDGWTQEADEQLAAMDTGYQESATKLQGTYDEGAQQLEEEYAKGTGKIDSTVADLRSEMSSKASEISQQSMFSRFMSGLGNFFMGLVDAVVDFLKVLAIIALVIVAIVVVVAVIAFIIGGGPAVLAALGALASIGAGIMGVMAYVGVALAVFSVGMAVYSTYQAWMDPNLTTDEKWRATGKGVGDIVLEFLPDFGMSFLTKGDDVADAAKAADNIVDAVNASDNLVDGAKAGDNIVDAAKAGDDVVDGVNAGDNVVKAGDDIVDGVNAGDNVVKAGDDVVDGANAGDNVVKSGDDANLIAKNGDELDEVDDAVDAVHDMDNAPKVEEPVNPAPESLSNAQTREWYHKKLDGIKDEIDPSLSYEGQARQAMELRNKYKLEARTLMQEQATALALPPPKTPEEVIAKYRSQGKEGDDLWLEILGSSARSNKEVDNAVGITRGANTAEDGSGAVDDGYKAFEDNVLNRIDEGGQEAVLDRVIKSDDPLEQQRVMKMMEEYEDIMRKDPQDMTPKEMDLVISAQAELARGWEDADTMRKVIPEGDISKYLSGEYDNVGGSVGDARNTNDLLPKEIVAKLGLDYTQQLPDGTEIQPYLKADPSSPTGKAAVDELFYMDMPMNDDLAAAQVPMDKTLVQHAKKSTNTDAKYLTDNDQLMNNGEWQDVRPNVDGTKDLTNPYTGTGGTAPSPEMLPDAPRMNQERQLANRVDLPDGTQIKYLGPDGEDVILATLHKSTDGTTEWAYNPDLSPEMQAKVAGMATP